MPESPHSPALGLGSSGGSRAPAHPREAPAAGTYGASGGRDPWAAPGSTEPSSAPSPENARVPSPPVRGPFFPHPPAPGGHAIRRARVAPLRRPRARAPARSGRSPDVPPAPARAHPAPSRAAQPGRPVQPLPGVPGGCEGLQGRCPESPEPDRTLGGGGGASLTERRLRAAPGPRGAPGIFFCETSPRSVGLSRPGRKSAQRREAETIRELRWM